MSNYSGNEQECVHFYVENGTNVKPPIAYAQIVFDGPTNLVKVVLSQNCSTIAEHAVFLQGKINESEGNLIGLQLNGPVALASVFSGNAAMIDHNVPLEVDCNYTFRFKLARVHEEVMEENVPDPVEELTKRVAQLAKEKEELKKQVDGEAGKMAYLVEDQAKKQDRFEQLEKRVEELEKEEKRQKPLEDAEAKAKLEEEQRMAPILEYARLIEVPNVANLLTNYDREKLLHLIEHGNMPSIYVQRNQRLNDNAILQSIVDLLATAEEPTKMLGEVTIEMGGFWFTWPKREELKLKENKSNVAITYNAASAPPLNDSGYQLAEYELANRRGCHFQVFIYYWGENFNKSVNKFIYRRLP